MLQRLKHLLFSLPSKNSAEWLAGFTEGYHAAWETMSPLMQEGIQRAKESIRDQAVDETLARLDVIIKKRFEDSSNSHLKPISDMLSKREQFYIALNSATETEEKKKYEHYLTCLNWMLNGSTQPDSH